MKSQKCLHCGLINFAGAEVCKRCAVQISGHQTQAAFENNHAAPAYAANNSMALSNHTAQSIWASDGFRQIIYGLLWITGGIILTYFTHSIFYGAIIFGVFDVFRGIIGLFTETDN